jgi:L,D-transpeptidase YcbB
MSRSLFRVASALLALTLFVSVADAAQQEPRRRKTFLESLFGTKQERAARKAERDKVRVIRQKKAWWLDDDQDVAIKTLKPAKNVKPVGDGGSFDDPEPIPGFGLGNVAFVLPRLPVVSDKGFSRLTATGIAADSVRLVLADASSPIKAEAPVRDAVLAHYSSSGFKPLWLDNGVPSARAKAVMAVLKAADAEGLVPGRYLPPGLAAFDTAEVDISGSSLAAAQFDVGLSVAATSYAKHVSGGQFEPNRLSLYYDIKPEFVAPSLALKVLAYSPFPDVYLASVVPQHPAYAALKQELKRVNEGTIVRDEPFPAGKRIKIGQKDERIPLLRERMFANGFMSADEAEVTLEKELVLDKTLAKALKAFQAASSIPQTGNLDQATVDAFNGSGAEADREKIISSLERVRWLPKNLGTHHVFVNQAAFELAVKSDGKTVWQSKVIVGRPTTQTNVFSDVMENVVFNPTWGMPQSILINEYLGKLRRDPGYFDKIGYSVVNASGKKVSSRSVSWGSIQPGAISVVQPAGDGNALGELKFNFPNAHAIYMHDTPSRNLFGEQRRAFSHGCVRVHNPREFAQVLLGISPEEVEKRIERGETNTEKLGKRIDVHLSYFTAWPDETGKIRYFSDIYQRDATLERARAIVAKSFGGDSTVKIVEKSASAATIDGGISD